MRAAPGGAVSSPRPDPSLEPALETRGPTADPGLRARIDATITTARRLFDAHLKLLQAELEPIKENVKAASAAVGAAVGAALFAVLLVIVGLPLFLGELVFGSMGWGIVHGVLTSAVVIVAGASYIVRDDPRLITRAVVVGLLVGIPIGVVFGLSLPHGAWVAVAETLDLGLPEGLVLPVVALGISAIAGAVVGAIAGAARRDATVVDGLVIGTFVGLAFGALTAYPFGDVRDADLGGVAVGVTACLVGILAVLGADLAARPIDGEAIKARYMPQQSIAAAQETLEWLQEQMPGGRE